MTTQGMKAFTLALTLLILAACAREETGSRTATIAPAEPRPAPTTATDALADERMITTAGSPAPAMRTATIEQVVISDGRIELRPLLPRMHTVFRVRNASTRPHALRVSAGEIATTMTRPLPPGGEILLQIELRRGHHIVTCTIPGHAERSTFETYEPGDRLQAPGSVN